MPYKIDIRTLEDRIKDIVLTEGQAMFMFENRFVYWLYKHWQYVDYTMAPKRLIGMGDPIKGIHIMKDKYQYLTISDYEATSRKRYQQEKTISKNKRFGTKSGGK